MVATMRIKQYTRYEQEFQAAKPGLSISHSWSLKPCCRQRKPSNCMGDAVCKHSNVCGFVHSFLCARHYLCMRISSSTV